MKINYRLVIQDLKQKMIIIPVYVIGGYMVTHLFGLM